MNATVLLAALLAIPAAAAPALANGAALKGPHVFAFPASGTRTADAQTHPRRAFATPGDVGTANDVTADPLVSRPAEAPCVATLFSGATFATYGPQAFAYAPPAGCPGPYAKIVFNGDFSVSAGRQFDRTASIEIGNVPIFFGTTAEPRSTLSPTWHLERDMTDDAALLGRPQSGEADIFNIVNATYTGVIGGTAYLQFYPARGRFAAAETPDVVMPLPGLAGGPQHLDTGSSTLSATYTLPQNVDRAYLDVYAQGQQNDEFFYTCAPNVIAAQLFTCGNGPLRETEVSIDGVPAGTAPVTPYIFTGGIDPYLWAPIPGVETLELRPYRVVLTPFAGLLANGKPHVIALSVDNADAYFQGFATLFAYRDRGVTRITGGVLRNTLVANPAPSVVERLGGASPSVDGTIAVTSRRAYAIAGYVVGSAGRTDTTLDAELEFGNKQTYANESATTGTTTILQRTTADTRVTTFERGAARFERGYVSYPLSLQIATVLDRTGTGTQTTSVDQHVIRASVTNGSAGLAGHYDSNRVMSVDTLDIGNGSSITGHTGMTSSQRYDAAGLEGGCYSQTIRAADGRLTSVSNAPCDRAASQDLRSLTRGSR